MSTPWFIVLISAYVYIVSGQQRGDLRFSGSFADGASGRLEVFIDNQWGTICVDGFTKRSADTACRQLGSFEALTFGEAERLGYGRGSGQIHITELECSRNDIHILHCTVRDDQQCDHSSDVAIICSAITAFQFDGGIRLLGGSRRSEGRLELNFFEQWGGVCGQSFDVIAADAACVALGYTRSTPGRSFSLVSRNMSGPVWVTSSSINCASTRSCFSSCYSDPTEGNDLLFRCSNDFVYLNCEFEEVTNSQCLANPFDPNPNNRDFDVDGTIEESDETDQTGVIVGIIVGVIFVSILLVFCTKLKGYKVIGSIYESCCGCIESCYGGCLSILRVFDVRQYFRNEDSGNTGARADTYTPNVEPRSNTNQELEELELAAMNEPSSPQRPSSSSSDSEHGDQQGSNEPPDYRRALKFCDTKASEKDDTKPPSDDQPPPPSYDSVV